MSINTKKYKTNYKILGTSFLETKVKTYISCLCLKLKKIVEKHHPGVARFVFNNQYIYERYFGTNLTYHDKIRSGVDIGTKLMNVQFFCNHQRRIHIMSSEANVL